MTEPIPGASATSPEAQIARRTIVKGAAWAVPVIVVAAGSPSAAASEDLCADPPVEVRADALAWNDYANGTNAVGTYQGRPVYGANQPLFADLTLTNEGTTTITGFQVTFTLAKGSYDPTSVNIEWVRPDGTTVPADVVHPTYTPSDAPHLDGLPVSFFTIPTTPGESRVFRITWQTAASTGGTPIDSGIYGIGQARSVDCNGNDVARSIADELNPSNNDAYVSNPFWVSSP